MTKIPFIVLCTIAALVVPITFGASFSAPGIQASSTVAQQQPNILHHMMNHTGTSHPQLLPSVQSSSARGKFFSANGINFVKGVRITNISQVGDDHLVINLNYTGDGNPPGMSVIALALTLPEMMNGIMMVQQNSTMKMMNESQQSMMTTMKEGGQLQQQQRQHQQVQNSTAFDGSGNSNSNSIQSMHSGSNYLESGWPGAESNRATVLVQLNGSIESNHTMVMVVPLLHH